MKKIGDNINNKQININKKKDWIYVKILFYIEYNFSTFLNYLKQF